MAAVQAPPMAQQAPGTFSEKSEVVHEKPPRPHSNVVTLEEFLSPSFKPVAMEKVIRESILLAAGGYAVLLQMAMEGVAKGVDEHSNFAYRPTDRLRTTMTYVYCMVYGTVHEKKTIIEWVHRAHSSVKGPDYNADDPELQLWVAATLFAAGMEVYEMFFGKPTVAEQNRIYREYSIIATSLRVPPHMWPRNKEAFWQYWDHKIATLEINQNAKNVCQDLMFNKHGPLWVRANLPMARVLTSEWLSPRMREAYGLNRHPKTYKFLMAMGKVVYPALPKFIRTYPTRYYLKDMRKRIKKQGDGKWQ